ncbi:putative trans-aconitate 2-methyltransferase [Chytriomyces sp. MP71]|nr:putative trans-aconitate 2-methyltransferase [Chytriomyces sp. MP71]
MAATARASRVWTPAHYLRFGSERLRPAVDMLTQARHSLAQRGPQESDMKIADLGCGTGNISEFLMDAFPDARIECVDSSPEMLATARQSHQEQGIGKDNITYTQADFETFTASSLDLIFSNSALHWVSFDVHQRLLPRYMSFLKPGGVLAFQIPDTRSQPSHLLMAEAARQLGFQDRIASTRWVTCERDPEDYFKVLSPLCASINMWHTNFTHILEGENPVADFTASTGLGPYVDALGGKESEDGKAFVVKYRELIASAYPKQEGGKTLFHFNRFFVVAEKRA